MADTYTSILDATITLNGNGVSSTQEVTPAVSNTASVGPYRTTGTVGAGSFLQLFPASTFAAGSWAVLTFSVNSNTIYLNGSNQGAAGYQLTSAAGNPVVLPIGPQTVLGIYNAGGTSVDVQLDVY